MLTAHERWLVLLLALLAVAGALAEALSIGAVFPFMALLTNPDAALAHPLTQRFSDRLGGVGFEQLVLIAALALLILFLIKNVFLIGLYAFQSRFVCRVESRIGIALITAYLYAPFTERLSRNSADKIRIITSEVGRVTVGVMQALITLFSEGLVIAAIALLMLVAQPIVAVVTLVVGGVVALLMQTIFRRVLDSHRESRVLTLGAMYRWVNEGLGAQKEIKVLGREAFVVNEFAQNSRAYAHGTYIFTTLNLLPRIIFETTAVSAMLLAVIATLVAGVALPEIVPALTIFGLAAIRLMPSSSRILSSLNTLRYYVPAVETVASDLRQTPSDEVLLPSVADVAAHPSREPLRSLRFESVSYCYPGVPKPSLKAIDLRVQRGEAIAIVGRSGSGKTTLADMLLGLLDPTSGSIEVNDRPVSSLRAEFRGIAGLVPQEFFLIDDTVRRNVAFGLPDALIDDSRVWKALAMARLDERVRALPLGLDSPVGERGATLSGGERQRLGIARALYTDPDILVLDEATSALDAATEAEFVGVLRSLRGTKTILAITHRAAAAGWCDRVLVMSEGRIVADGPFAEVSRTHPAFAELVHSDPGSDAAEAQI